MKMQRAVSAIVLMLVSGLAMATSPYMEYREHVKGAESLTALKDNLFGDATNLYDGGTEFTATDVDLPGNNALPVRISRRYSIEITPSGTNGEADSHLLGAGNWDVDVPYIEGTYISGQGWPSNRCTVSTMPSASGFEPTDFWHGNTIHVPGDGDRALLLIAANTPVPNDGLIHKYTTVKRDSITCLSSLKAGPGNLTGEGFRMQTSAGLTYYFDVPVSRYIGYMTRELSEYNFSFNVSRIKYYLLASRIEDRFGNYVDYSYNAVGQPTQILSSDGRKIVLTYAGGRLSKAVANGREWDYGYGTSGDNAGMLTSVTLPDQSKWSYSYNGTLYPEADGTQDGSFGCGLKPIIIPNSFALTITHPSGAIGTFGFANTRHFRSGVHKGECIKEQIQQNGTWYTVHKLHTPNYFDVMSLYSKTITGPGLANRTWSYDYGVTHEDLWGSGSVATYPCTTCDTEKLVTVINPDQTRVQYHYGFLFTVNEGRVLSSSIQDADGMVKRTQTTTYMPADAAGYGGGQNFFYLYGYGLGMTDPLPLYVQPIIAQTTTQDGVTFSWSVPTGCSTSTQYCFDAYGNPTKAIRSSTLGYSRTEQTTYFNQTTAWILGQVASVKCVAPTTALPAGCGSSGTVMSETTYDTTYGVPLTTKSFGKLQQTLTYTFTTGTQDGTLHTVKDGNNHVTTLSNWYRGIPKTIGYADGTGMSATVDANGWITSVVDENGYSTGYGYDSVGRLAAIVYPTGDSTAWNDTTITYQQIAASEYGIPTGHWKRTESTGNGRKITYYDGMWRPLVTEQYDTANASNTRSLTVQRYDLAGQLAFQSYPLSSLTSYASTSLKGIDTFYDALDRVTETDQDAETTQPLKTLTTYLTGFKTQVTNPRNYKTITAFMAFDQPSTDWPVDIDQADGQAEEADVDIGRDIFGKPTAIVRHNPGNTVTETRSYVYDQFQLLCKTIEPEMGSTLVDYDGANNVIWSASGQALPGLGCDRTSVAVANQTTRSYDARNRLLALRFPGGRGDQDWTYTPDGLPEQITTYNGANESIPVIDAYHYNKRRMLDGVGESIEQPDWYTWSLGHGYDGNGHLSVQTYPGNVQVAFAPNALGQPTQAGSYVTGATYYPNGAIKQFTYGNGIVHTMTQNARQLPDTSTDAYGSTRFLSDGYDYDANGNVAAITDGATGRGQRGNRTMSYDALDRLLSAASPMFGNGATGTASFTYDALDNLTKLVMPATATTAARTQYYCYDNTTRRLASLRSAANCGGTVQTSLTYDAQGNLASKGTQGYVFGKDNRLYGVTGKESYRYDGWGHRVLQYASDGSGNLLSQYTREGQLLVTADYRRHVTYRYVYLGGSLVAIRETPFGSSTSTIKYQHTDALGTPVAVTDENRAVVERSEYEPYGQLLNRPQHDGPGFTGHVQDALTGLTYMQQRYYDPMIGRFLSVDPVTASSVGGNFNRYWYGNDNPYKFTDPDGRFGCVSSHIEAKCASDGFASTSFRSPIDTGRMVPNRQTPSRPQVDAGSKYAAGSGTKNFNNAYRTAKRIGNEELERTRKLTDDYNRGGHNDLYDAERHARWTYRMSKEIGPRWADLFSGMHEFQEEISVDPQPFIEMRMDSANNLFGIRAFERGSRIPTISSPGLVYIKDGELIEQH